MFWKELRQWYAIRQVFEPLGAREYRHRATGIIFVRIQSGSVRRGSPEDEEGALPWEQPVHDAPVGEFRGKPIAVDRLRPNAYGLYHMHGNVAEWCEDAYNADFYASPDARSPNPTCHRGSGDRVVRGGSWKDRPIYCRSTSRSWADPASTSQKIGNHPAFRLPIR